MDFNILEKIKINPPLAEKGGAKMSQKTIEKIVRFFGKLEGALKKYPSETRVVIVVLFCFWATNFVSMAINHEIGFPETKSAVVEQKTSVNHGLLYRNANSPGEQMPWEKEGWKNWSSRMLNWLLLIYLRSLPLIALLYLARMAGRRGLLATVLADKKRFILAIIGWPIMIFRYPHNVAREIIVTAELRRMGDAFRAFSLREREVVREVANGSRADFRQWRRELYIAHAGDFRRSFSLALIITIVMVFIFSSLSNAKGNPSAEKARNCYLAADANAPPGTCCLSESPTGSDHSDWGHNAEAGVLTNLLLDIRMVVVGMVEFLKTIKPPSMTRLIFHVPEFSPVVVS